MSKEEATKLFQMNENSTIMQEIELENLEKL